MSNFNRVITEEDYNTQKVVLLNNKVLVIEEKLNAILYKLTGKKEFVIDNVKGLDVTGSEAKKQPMAFFDKIHNSIDATKNELVLTESNVEKLNNLSSCLLEMLNEQMSLVNSSDQMITGGMATLNFNNSNSTAKM